MNDGLKQRLIGAVVLLSVALIIWPLVFSTGADKQVDQSSQIPNTPNFNKYTVAEPVRPENIPPLVRPIEKSSLPPAIINDQLPQIAEPPKLDKQGFPQAWVLQVASFKKAENAELVTKALLEKGHKAFTRTIATSTGDSIRVFIGPRLTKNAFDKNKAEIDKEFSVESMVVRYQQ